jgi:hypothetical protein
MKLASDALVSIFAFDFNLRRYSKAADFDEATDELHEIVSLTGNLNLPSAVLPSPVIVTGGASLVVKLTSDYSVHNAGFKATFREATEEEVDGAKAEERTCFDGVMNGGETGVDCGGPMPGKAVLVDPIKPTLKLWN